jgi:glycosyltransferase involved in cell wall biosynthesis/SAM-dependent methyltransferase
MIDACTIVARNYLPHARVLGESFLAHHADGRFTVLVIDDNADAPAMDERAPAHRLLRLADLGLDTREIGRLAGVYDVTELSTAVKPLLLRKLLEEERDHIIYLDPDIKIYSSLQDAAALAVNHSIVLTPHTMRPIPRDGRRVANANILSSGVFNLGFLGLGRRTSDFLSWWWEQTRREALSDIDRMMFTDQRCMDLVPCLFEHFILKDPGYNVAYWNLHGRNLQWTGSGYTVDRLPLRFFHFSGFDHRHPHLLSKHQLDQPRILLSDRSVVSRICREYAADLKRLGADDEGSSQYGWARLPGGFPLSRRIRRLYWEALVESERNGKSEPPNPFAAPEQFVQWLNEPVEPAIRPRISRLLNSIYNERPDLRAAFPRLAGDDAARYLTWVLKEGVRQEPMHQDLLPTADMVARAKDPIFALPTEVTPGLNLVGYFKTVTGVGEHARLLGESLKTTEVPYTTLTIGGTESLENESHVERGDRRATYDCNLLCVNADQTVEIASKLGPGFFESRYNIGYWAWELERLPEWMHGAFDVVDEVWCASRFVTEAVRSTGRRPAYTIPYPFVVPEFRNGTVRARYGLPDRFMFLFIFDFLSIAERKNPLGLVEAFTKAFSVKEEPILVIKSINGSKRLNELERLRARVAGLSNVLLLEEYLTAEQKNGLLSLCDCYASLHRSEGTGITLAEAMALGKPVIGTAYSGSLDFMTERNSYLVDYVKTEVPSGCSPYPAGYLWADPLIDHAAEQMRQVYERRDEASRRGAQARKDILDKHSPSVCGRRIVARLEEIRAARKERVAVGSPTALGATSFPRPAAELLYRASAMLTPAAEVPQPSRLRGARLKAQRLMLRAIRPYWWGQRQLSSLLISAIERVDQTHTSDDLNLRARLGSIESRLPEFETSVMSRLKSVESKQATMNELMSEFFLSASNHLGALTTGVSQLEGRVQELFNRLYAPPFMSDPDQLSYRDEAGRRILGFRTNGETRGGYIGFENIFRGTESFIRDRLRAYQPLLDRDGPIVDIGCGRGEFLELVRELGRMACGVDTDEQMVRHCLSKGLNATLGDGIEFLERQPDSSLAVVFSSQVIEHFSDEAIVAFFDVAFRKLQPRGILIAETVNPHSLEALKGFWVDLTHRHPIFPEVALSLCWLRRFGSAYVVFPHGTGDFDADRRTQGEYAVVATKPSV